jgi:hypothetical protein
VLLAPRLEVSRRRMLLVDLGAAAGVAAGWLLYPLVQDGDTNNDEQALGLVSTLTLGAGAVVAWVMTRGMDDDGDDRESAARHDPPPPPGLLQRTAAGRWEPGLPALRPLSTPQAATPAGGGVVLDLLSGRF